MVSFWAPVMVAQLQFPTQRIVCGVHKRMKLHHRLLCRAEPPSEEAAAKEPIYLSDFMQFESELTEDPLEDASDGHEIIDRASKALENAQDFLNTVNEGSTPQGEAISHDEPAVERIFTNQDPVDTPSSPPPAAPEKLDPAFSSTSQLSWASENEVKDGERKREVLRGALQSLEDNVGASHTPRRSGEEKPWENPKWKPSPWEAEPQDSGNVPQLMKDEDRADEMLVMDKQEPVTLIMTSQMASDLMASKSKSLPPLQSVVELTSAHMPPTQGGTAGMESGAGMELEDGSGVLSDGTKWERKSGEEYGENGYWKRWTVLQGTTAGGKVEWQETWWEVSDWLGLREYGALKTGTGADGGSWRETWTEKVYTDSVKKARCVDRYANKWASKAGGDEWEEKWDEHYCQNGEVNKSADKWAKEGSQVWHEKWGENYDGSGGCLKWTDKWAEALTGSGKVEWGDKWEEGFSHGKGSKRGETWNIGEDGYRHQEWWGENHFGDGYVQKHGKNTSGNSWDVTEKMDTYYNPIPHFGYQHAISHSPRLLEIPELPKDDMNGELSPGLGAL